MIVNSYEKVKCIYRLCNDDIIIAPNMLQIDIQPHCLSLRAYHCGIWYFGTLFVDGFPQSYR